MRDYILQKFWHEYLGIKANDFANDIKQDACHGNLNLRSCYFFWRARGCAFFPNPLSISPLVRALTLQQNPPANSLFAQLPWYTLFAPSIPRQFFLVVVFSISIILNFSLKVMQNVRGAQGAIWKMCIWSVNLV